MMIIYVLVVLSLIFALASLAVDYGRVQLAKTQLRICTDVAAKWGAYAVKDGKAAVAARATAAAPDNKVNGQVQTFTAADVQVGSWNGDTRTFTPDATPADAVKLTGTAVVPLVFGGLIQKPNVTIRASAVARAASTPGILGLESITFMNNAFVGSYDSSVTTAPTQATAGDNARIASNSLIQAQNNGTVLGDVEYGPSGSVNVKSWTVSGEIMQTASPIAGPAEADYNHASNPGGVSNGHYTHPGGTLNGGIYHFTRLTIAGPLNFNGPATIYVNGDIAINGTGSSISVTAYGNVPSNLMIYQVGPNRTFTAVNNARITAVVVAPRTTFEAKNMLHWYGQLAFKSITLLNNAEFFMDERVAMAQSVGLVQ